MYLIYLPYLVLIVATVVYFATDKPKVTEYSRMAAFASGLVILWDIGVK